jgi:hypothetical protein
MCVSTPVRYLLLHGVNQADLSGNQRLVLIFFFFFGQGGGESPNIFTVHHPPAPAPAPHPPGHRWWWTGGTTEIDPAASSGPPASAVHPVRLDKVTVYYSSRVHSSQILTLNLLGSSNQRKLK